MENGIAEGLIPTAISLLLLTRTDSKNLSVSFRKTISEKMKALLSLRPIDFKFQTPSVREPRTVLRWENIVKKW